MKRSLAFLIIIFACLLAVFSTGSIQPVTAQAPSPQDSHWIEFPEMQRAAQSVRASLLAAPPPDPGSQPEPLPAQPESVQPQAVLSWAHLGGYSKLVFQQWFGDNYEIVVADGDGNNPVRLTNNLAADMRPEFNPDATKIFFASNREGNFEIYSMNLDGSDVRNLTNSPKTDTRPKVSPDGTHIAFVSDRGGRPQIYMMDLATGKANQLTGAPPGYGAYDCAWSPDTRKIAFSALNDHGAGFVYFIDLATHQVYKTHWNELYVIYDLAWQPGLSNLVAFDAISPNDTYALSSIYTVEINENYTKYPVRITSQSQNSYSDCWVSTWMLDPQYLLIEIAEYIREGDYLYLKRVHFIVMEVAHTSPPLPGNLLSNPDYAMDADWVRTDWSAPTSRINPLPPFSRANAIELSWSGSYNQGASIHEVNISMSSGSNQHFTRINYWPITTTSYSTTAEPGIQVFYGTTAINELGVSEPNPPTGERVTTTRTYQHEFSGKIIDHHGAPLPDITVVTQPAAVNNPSSGADGRFLAFLDPLSDTKPLNIVPTTPGYGSSPSTSIPFSSRTDLAYDIVLPPVNDVILNGNFEIAGSMDPWQESGTLNFHNLTDAFHSGTRGIDLGGCDTNCLEAYGPPIQLAHDNQHEYFVTPDGSGLVLEINNNGQSLVAYHQISDGSWSGPLEVINSPEQISNAMALPAENGDLTVCWMQKPSYYLYCAQKPAGGIWQAPFNVYEFKNLSVDHQGRLYKSEYSGISVWQDGAWTLLDYCTGTTEYTRFTFDADNNPIMVVYQSNVGLVTSICTGGQWQPFQKLRSGGINGTLDFYHWTTNSHGWSLLVVSNQIWLRSPDGIWKQPIKSPVSSDNLNFAVGPNGELYYYYYQYLNNNVFLYDELIGWRLIESAPDGDIVGFGLDPNGQLLAIKMQSDKTYSTIQAFRQSRAAESADGGLSQTVTIPAGSHRPTLSFVYRLLGMQDSLGSSFEVTLAQGADTTTLFSTDQGASDWLHVPIDLTSWAGQTVTLNFVLHQAAGGTMPELNLDEVSLGEWLTPLVTSAEPASINVIDPPLTISIHGENFFDKPTVWIDAQEIPAGLVAYVNDTTLTVTLASASMRPGAHTVKVVNPSGHAGALANAIQTGVPLYLPLIRR